MTDKDPNLVKTIWQSRALIALLVVDLSVSVVAVIIALRSSELAVQAQIKAVEAGAQIRILEGEARECADTAKRNNQILEQMREHWPK